MNNQIHPSACVDPGAVLSGVTVGPFCLIHPSVSIGQGTVLQSHAVIHPHTVIGSNNIIGEHSVIGGNPQDVSFDTKTISGVQIGDNNIIREFVTIHRSTKDNGKTLVGNDNMLMAVSHIAHDVVLGNNVIIANNSLLAGHVHVNDNAFISGNCAVHQFVHIGRFVMIAGITKLSQDAPPFSLIEGYPGMYRALNIVGLKRAGFSSEERLCIKRCYSILYQSTSNIRSAIENARKECRDALSLEIINFAASSSRGIVPRFH